MSRAEPSILGVVTIRINAELEALIKQDVQRGPYRTEVAAKIEEGYNAALRGDLMDGGQLRARMEERKQAWTADQRRNK